MTSPRVSAARRHIALTRHKGADHPDAIAAGQEWAVEAILERIEEVLAKAPPISKEHWSRIVDFFEG